MTVDVRQSNGIFGLKKAHRIKEQTETMKISSHMHATRREAAVHPFSPKQIGVG